MKRVCALGVALFAACQRAPPPAAPTTVDATARDAAIDSPAPDVRAPPPSIDAGPARVLTIRVTNVGTLPLAILTNPDTNEILHTRKLRDRPAPDASLATRDGELVKFFPVGQEPMCGADAGAGYGGLGQPAPRTLAHGESIEFQWDGVLRHEVLGPLGVCQQDGPPEPGRYRFEFDQPYNVPQCGHPTIFTWPLPPGMNRTIEIGCVARPIHHGEEN